jgi:dihydrodipicolinate synthase/N-acetylneuraminate lyase
MSPHRQPSDRAPRLPASYRGAGDPLRKPLADPLWVPVLSHYRGAGDLDVDRMAAQIRALRPHLRQLMLAGSTGDGWELGEPAFEQVIALAWRTDVLDRDCPLLLGVLRPTTEAVLRRLAVVERMVGELPETAAPVLGVAVCPPVDPAATQAAILRHFERLAAATSLPIAIYQLPQVTGCAIAPETMREMSGWQRVVMFKDSSGADAVVAARGLHRDVVLLRGAEGDYAEALAPAVGYDGWLLSTGNSFPASLRELARRLAAGDADGAGRLSNDLTRAVGGLFAAAGSVGFGNAFSNANRAGDHILAWGARWDRAAPPCTISGQQLPRELLAAAAAALAAVGEMPKVGYLES